MNGRLLESPFYKPLARRNESLDCYPLVNKSIFMKNFDSINTKGIKREEALDVAIQAEISRNFTPMIGEVTIGLSSGTSGNQGVFLATENERAQWVACVLDRVIGFSLKKRSVAFFLRANSNLYDSVKSKVLKFDFFDLMEPLENQLSRLELVNPSILVAQPSLLLELAKKKVNGELAIFPKKIISVAEVLYPEDAVRLEEVFEQTIHQVYQCTEGLLATTCKYGTLHFNEDFLIIEKKYIDAEKTRFHPVITDLMRTTQPVVRYELNDIIHEKKNCKCDNNMTGIEKIEGRSDDILIFNSIDGKQVKIFPDFFRRAIIMSNNQISDYTLVQFGENELELFVENNSKIFDQAKDAIEKLLELNNIYGVNLIKSNAKHHDKGNKLRRIKKAI